MKNGQEKKVTVELTELEAEKVYACVMLAIADDRLAIIRDPDDQELVQKVRFYERLADKFGREENR